MQDDLSLAVIGIVRTPWATLDACPADKPAPGLTSMIDLAPEYRPGLLGLGAGDRIFVLVWIAEAERDRIVQFPPGSREPRGVFALQTPDRPNPFGLYGAAVLSADLDRGVLVTSAISCPDGAPVLDVRPQRARGAASPGERQGFN